LIEIRQDSRNPAHLGFINLPPGDGIIQHAFPGQPAHFDQPVHRLALASQFKLSRIIYRQRYNPKIDVPGQAAVQPEFFQAIQMASFQGAEVKEIQPHRLFQLIDKTIGQENPGHVGLNGLDTGRMFRVGRRSTKKGDLA